MGAFPFWAQCRGIRTRQGAELRKRASVYQRSTRGAKRRSGARAAKPHADIPHRPPLNWKRSSKGDRFCLGPSQRDSNPPGCGAEETRKRFPAQHARAAGPKRKRAAKPHATSLIAHHLIEKAPSDGGLSFLGPVQRDSNPPECGAEETRSVFQRSTRGAERRSGARAAPAARGHPSSPTTELETVLERGPFLFGPISWDSNPPARLSQRPWPENGKNEYCYLAYNISEDNICLSYATYVHYKD